MYKHVVWLAGLALMVGCSKSPAIQSTADQSSSTAATKTATAHESHHHDHAAATSTDQAGQSGLTSRYADATAAGVVDEPLVPPVDAQSPPETVVIAFLEATRHGDDQTAAGLLSSKALEATAQVGLAVKPPGTPSMKYTISNIEYPEHSPDGAYVHSRWTEELDAGESSYDVTWVLRRQTEGWRIVGMAAELSPGEPPYFLNFEQPEDLVRRMQEATGAPDPSSPAADASDIPHTAAGPAAELR